MSTAVAMLLDFRYDIVAANAVAYRLGFAGNGARGSQRICFWRSFLTPEVLRLSSPWRDVPRSHRWWAILRRLYAESHGDARLEALIRELRERSEPFAQLRDARGVAASSSRHLPLSVTDRCRDYGWKTVVLAAESGLRCCYFVPLDDGSREHFRIYCASN